MVHNFKDFVGHTTIPKEQRPGLSLLTALCEEEVGEWFFKEISGRTNNLVGPPEENRSEVIVNFIKLLIPAQVKLIRDGIGGLVGDWIRSPEIFDHNGARVLLALVAEIPVPSGKRQIKNCFNVRGELKYIPPMYLEDLIAVLAKLAEKEDRELWESLHDHSDEEVSRTARSVSSRINYMK